jgi:hypothetical protein
MSVPLGYFVPIREHSLRLHVALRQKRHRQLQVIAVQQSATVFRINGTRSDLVFRALAHTFEPVPALSGAPSENAMMRHNRAPCERSSFCQTGKAFARSGYEV